MSSIGRAELSSVIIDALFVSCCKVSVGSPVVTCESCSQWAGPNGTDQLPFAVQWLLAPRGQHRVSVTISQYQNTTITAGMSIGDTARVNRRVTLAASLALHGAAAAAAPPQQRHRRRRQYSTTRRHISETFPVRSNPKSVG